MINYFYVSLIFIIMEELNALYKKFYELAVSLGFARQDKDLQKISNEIFDKLTQSNMKGKTAVSSDEAKKNSSVPPVNKTKDKVSIKLDIKKYLKSLISNDGMAEISEYPKDVSQTEKIKTLKEVLSEVEMPNNDDLFRLVFNEILKFFEDCFENKEFIKIISPYCQGRMFWCFDNLKSTKRHIIFWLNVGGLMDFCHFWDLAAYHREDIKYLDELIGLYKSKGYEVKDKDMKYLEVTLETGKLVNPLTGRFDDYDPMNELEYEGYTDPDFAAEYEAKRRTAMMED